MIEAASTARPPTVRPGALDSTGRSQMAMGFFAHHAGAGGIAWSRGTEPGIEVNPAAVAAMAERGIDI